jgi:hypothetical protein
LPYSHVDTIEFGPIRLRDIEWIEFPEVAEYPPIPPNSVGKTPSTSVKQDIVALEQYLAEIGKFPVERTARGLRINGHIRQYCQPK